MPNSFYSLTIRELAVFGAITYVLERGPGNCFILRMRDPIKEPKYWRDRAKATSEKAKQYYDVRQIRQMLRVAEEYDKIADRAAAWRRRHGDSQSEKLVD